MNRLMSRRTPLAIALAFGGAPALGQTPMPPASPASAASASAETTLPPVKVKATGQTATTEGARSYTTGSMNTATGLNLSIRDTPQSVTVITRERLDDQAATTIGDALRTTTGLSLKPVDRGRNNLSARGFDINNFQLDGVPMATGNIGLETANAILFDRVEVVRGATGLLSGAGDPSAAVNLVRKHADSEVFTGQVTAKLGSWNQRTGSIDLSAPLSSDGSVRARVVGFTSRQDAFIDLENTQNTVFYGVIDADLGTNTHLSIGASDQRDKRNGVLWGGLPYWYADGTRTDWDRSKTTATRWNQWDTTDQAVFATLTHKLDSQWVLRGDITHHRQDEDSKLLWVWGYPDRTTGLGMQSLLYHYIADPRQTHVSASATGPFTLLGREHELHVGAMHSQLKGGWFNRYPIPNTPQPLTNFNEWDGSFPEPPATDHFRASNGKTTQSAVYAAARLQLADPLKLIVGGRLSNWNRKEDAAVWTPEPYEINHNNILTPYAGLVYDLGTNLSAYASYTDTFNPQTNRDRGGAYLDPLTGTTYELGLKAEFFDGKLNASASVYRIKQDNFAVTDVGFNVPGTLTPASRESDGVKSQGYELEIAGQVAPGWELSVGWTQFIARDAERADVAVDHARRQLKLFTKYELQHALHGLSVGGGVTWESDRPATDVNPGTDLREKVGQPAYAVFDLMAKYEFDKQWSLQMNVSNLFDKTYRSGSYWWGSPLTYGEPRKFLLTADYRF